MAQKNKKGGIWGVFTSAFLLSLVAGGPATLNSCNEDGEFAPEQFTEIFSSVPFSAPCDSQTIRNYKRNNVPMVFSGNIADSLTKNNFDFSALKVSVSEVLTMQDTIKVTRKLDGVFCDDMVDSTAAKINADTTLAKALNKDNFSKNFGVNDSLNMMFYNSTDRMQQEATPKQMETIKIVVIPWTGNLLTAKEIKAGSDGMQKQFGKDYGLDQSGKTFYYSITSFTQVYLGHVANAMNGNKESQKIVRQMTPTIVAFDKHFTKNAPKFALNEVSTGRFLDEQKTFLANGDDKAPTADNNNNFKGQNGYNKHLSAAYSRAAATKMKAYG